MDFEALVTKALADAAFRKELIVDPSGTAIRHGFSVTDEELSMLRETDLEAMAFELDERASLSAMVAWAASL
jgi:hypothetical protein